MYIFDSYGANNKNSSGNVGKINVCMLEYIHFLTIWYLIVLKRINKYSYDSEAAAIESKIAVTKIKKQSQQILESTSIVLNEYTTSLSQAAKASTFY